MPTYPSPLLFTFSSSHFPATVRLLASFPRQADIDPAGHGTGHPLLAVNGNTDSFALCMSGTQNNIVYRPLVTSTQNDPSTCQQVKVQIIF